jgi:D-alanyl-D-alanine carboxypeptidase
MLKILTGFVVFSAIVSGFVLAGFSFVKTFHNTKENNTAYNNFNDAAAKVVEEIKVLSAAHFPQASQAKGKLPLSEDRPVKPAVAPFDLQAASGAVMDIRSGEVLFGKNADKEWPLASITKLMTALVFLEHNPGWDTVYQIRREDRREGGKIYLYTGEKVKVRDLFYLSLVGSANTATVGLVHSTGMDEEEFVREMNDKARAMGLAGTRFYDPVGLNNNNVSTAEEIAKFAKIALSNNDISKATLTKKYEFITIGGRKKTVYNTDDLLDIFPQNGIRITGGKTGYLELAGYCFVGKFIDHNGREMISVVLGGDTRDSRFTETRELVEWAYESFVW